MNPIGNQNGTVTQQTEILKKFDQNMGEKNKNSAQFQVKLPTVAELGNNNGK